MDNNASRPGRAEQHYRFDLHRVTGPAGEASPVDMAPPPVPGAGDHPQASAQRATSDALALTLGDATAASGGGSAATGVSGMRSVISSDLRITGQQLTIASRGPLQIDGHIQGDVKGTEIVIGELGHVDGSVTAETIVVRGAANGIVRGTKVSLQSGSRVDGEIVHASLAIEQGALFEGRARRHQNPLATASEEATDVVSMPRAFSGGRR